LRSLPPNAIPPLGPPPPPPPRPHLRQYMVHSTETPPRRVKKRLRVPSCPVCTPYIPLGDIELLIGSRKKKKKRRSHRHNPITAYFHPLTPWSSKSIGRSPMPANRRFKTRSYGSANIKDPPVQ
jgi:hypothetical protein